MKSLYIYISLFFFAACIMAPSALVIIDSHMKARKVAKLFDMEEDEDDRDKDSEKEKEKEASENMLDVFFVAMGIPKSIDNRLIHYPYYNYYLLEPAKELITPPPRS